MKVEFGKETPAAPVVDAEVVPGNSVPEAAPDFTPASGIPTTPAANTAVATRPVTPTDVAPSAASGFDEDDIDFNDIKLPRLNLVYGVGGLSEIYKPGEWVLDGSLVIHVPKNEKKNVAGQPPLNLTVLGFKKRQYVEKKEGGEKGNLFNTPEQVVKAGGTLDFEEAKSTGKTLYHVLATGLILVQKPEHIPDEDHLIFAHECEGKFYSLALWGMKSTMFTHAAKKIFTAKKLGHLKTVKDAEGKVIAGGYPSFSWNLTTKFETKYKQPTPIPLLTNGTKNTEVFKAFVKEVLSSGN